MNDAMQQTGGVSPKSPHLLEEQFMREGRGESES